MMTYINTAYVFYNYFFNYIYLPLFKILQSDGCLSTEYGNNYKAYIQDYAYICHMPQNIINSNQSQKWH